MTIVVRRNYSCFVKDISLKNDNCALTLQKRRFYDAKEPLLLGKSGSLGMRKRMFCNALADNRLSDRNVCKDSPWQY